MKIIIILVCILFPLFSEAQIISEIMYDISGTDTKREWIEIYNNTSSTISSTNLRLKENDVSRALTVITTSDIPAGEYAVIADNSDQFMIDNPDFSGILFDNVFSLNNEGESLSLLNSTGVTDTVSYTSSLGAKGDGNSLQLSGGIFISALPTPGKVNATEAVEAAPTPVSSTTTSSTSAISSHSSQVKITDEEEEVLVKIGAGRERVSLISTPISFNAITKTVKDVARPVFTWIFGDGNSAKGKNVEHVYRHPGEYNVVLHARSSGSYAVSRTVVFVNEPSLSISVSTTTKSIAVGNGSKVEVNIGKFELVSGEVSFIFPEDTIISPSKSIVIDEDLFKLPDEYSGVYLKSPSGKVIAESIP